MGLAMPTAGDRTEGPAEAPAVDKSAHFVHICQRMVGVVQLAEHQTVDLEVVGSRPITHP